MGRLYIDKTVLARGDIRLLNLGKGLFSGFCFNKASLSLENGKENTFLVGNISLPRIDEGCEYALQVNEGGIAILARDYGSLVRGFFSLLMKIKWEAGNDKLFIDEVYELGKYKIKNRMAHLCIFPETELDRLKKYIRLLGALQFTHVVIEIWGCMRYDCLNKLGWESSFSKSEIKELVSEIKELGMEPIPMFNSLGHASGCRSMSGKHTVLDQNPSLYYLFTPDGWAWDLENTQVWELLRNVRKELYEIFEGCKYFHLGFDESHSHNKNPYLAERLPYYLKRLCDEVTYEGKRPMIWIDMLLPPEAYNGFLPSCHSQKSITECLKILNSLPKSTVLIDWEYDVKKSPISTLAYYKDSGFDIMGASWLDDENIGAHIDTVCQYSLFGAMLTTWHTLFKNSDGIISFAKNFGAQLPWFYKESDNMMIAAALLRKLSFEKSDYFSSGFVKYQLDR